MHNGNDNDDDNVDNSEIGIDDDNDVDNDDDEIGGVLTIEASALFTLSFVSCQLPPDHEDNKDKDDADESDDDGGDNSVDNKPIRMLLLLMMMMILLMSMVLTIEALTLFTLGPVSSHLHPLRHFVLNNLDDHHDDDDGIVLSSCHGIPQECSVCGSQSSFVPDPISSFLP